MSNSSVNPVMCVMGIDDLAPYIQIHTPPHLPVNYMLECVLTLVGNSPNPGVIHLHEHLVHEYIDNVMGDYEYEEAMQRGLTDQEWYDWLGLVKGQVAECAIQIARTLYPNVKPILQICNTTYPNGCMLEVHKLATDGLYVDLVPLQPVPLAPPLSIGG